MYIKPERTLESFQRLHFRSVGKKLKAGRERTTILGVFLAYDMTGRGQGALSLNSSSDEGRDNRARFSTYYSKIFTLKQLSGFRALATYDLGEVTFCPGRKQMPGAKLVDNFLSRQLKEAAEGKIVAYPKRPRNSTVLSLGATAPNSIDHWQLKAHERWWENFPKLLAGRRSKTPYLDLAVFLLRDTDLDGRLSGPGVLEGGLRATFSEQLASRLIEKIKSEARHTEGKWLAQEPSTWLQSDYVCAFDEKNYVPASGIEKRLRDYIAGLQELLTDTGIPFDQFEE